MLLASVPGIRTELGFDDMTDINAAITMALHAAEPQLASALNTRFARAEVTDTFWVPEPTVIDGPHVSTEFWLSRGFLVAAPVALAADLDLSDAFDVDVEKGVVRDTRTRYSQARVAFTYTCGFESELGEGDDPQPTDSYKLTQVPGWLQEAAKLLALVHLANSPSITEAGIKIDTEVLKLQLGSMMEQHIRYAPMALYPI